MWELIRPVLYGFFWGVTIAFSLLSLRNYRRSVVFMRQTEKTNKKAHDLLDDMAIESRKRSLELIKLMEIYEKQGLLSEEQQIKLDEMRASVALH